VRHKLFLTHPDILEELFDEESIMKW